MKSKQVKNKRVIMNWPHTVKEEKIDQHNIPA